MNQNVARLQPPAQKSDLDVRLRNYLRRPTLTIGSRIPPERELAEVLGVGRTVLRPLLDALVQEGVLQKQPQSGTILKEIPVIRVVGQKVTLVASIAKPTPEQNQAWLYTVLGAFERQIRKNGVDLVIVDRSLDGHPLTRIVQDAIDEGAQAVVLLHPEASSDILWKVVSLLQDAHVHPVISSESSFPAIASSVHFDIDWGTYFVTRHLLGLGHRRIGYLPGSLEHDYPADGVNGFSRALDGAGITAEERCKPIIGEKGLTMLEQWLSYPPMVRPTALVAASDEAALKLLSAARERGIAIPQELSLVGIGNVPEALIAGLTTLALPPERLGEELARLTAELLVHGNSDVAASRQLQPAFIERDTVGPPPAIPT